MKIDMVMQLLPEQLSSYKKNIIKPMIDNIPIGEVVAVKEEYADGIYNCTVDVFPSALPMVQKAMSTEAKRLFDGS